jgi:hypothetical protein
MSSASSAAMVLIAALILIVATLAASVGWLVVTVMLALYLIPMFAWWQWLALAIIASVVVFAIGMAFTEI